MAYDLSREVERAVDRFEAHPEEKAETVYIPAYDPNTTPDNRFLNPVGRSVVFSEIYKLACMKKNLDYKKGISIFSAS